VADRGDVIKGLEGSIEFVETTAESGGERLVVEIDYAGTGNRPPAHFHPSQDEFFEILEGEIHARVGDEDHVLRPGDELHIPARTTHRMWAEVPSRQRWTTTPALRTERFFETMWGLQQDGETPSLHHAALILRHFSAEFRLATPPEPLQSLLTLPLAQLARLAGKPAEYSPKQ
jgi:mannose-6-phosphate isomerase-like protein (cupin superfamily)